MHILLTRIFRHDKSLIAAIALFLVINIWASIHVQADASVSAKSRNTNTSTSGQCTSDLNKVADIVVNVEAPNMEGSGEVNTEFFLAEIRSIAKSTFDHASDNIVAFADIRYAMNYTFKTTYFEHPNSETDCHFISNVTFNVTFESPPSVLFPKELYEDRDLDGGVCYDQVLAHEMQHIQDYETVFENIITAIEQDERFEPSTALPNKNQMLSWPRQQRESAGAFLESALQDYYRPVVENTMAEISENIARRAERLDSTEEYRRITELCADMQAYIQ